MHGNTHTTKKATELKNNKEEKLPEYSSLHFKNTADIQRHSHIGIAFNIYYVRKNNKNTHTHFYCIWSYNREQTQARMRLRL